MAPTTCIKFVGLKRALNINKMCVYCENCLFVGLKLPKNINKNYTCDLRH